MSDRVKRWLEQLALGQWAKAFEENEITWEILPSLDHDLLKELGVTVIGQRVRILKAIQSLDSERLRPETPSASNSHGQPSHSGDAERRQLTVMFCDLVGSTVLGAKLDPEDMREVITSFQDASRKAIGRYGGFIARYMGDGMLVYFGYPQAHEDDAERAVRAGLAIVRSMAELNTGIGKQHGVVLAVRIAVATGWVVVGDIVGDGAAEEAAVVGETPNLAARLQGVAAPDQVVVSSATQRLLGALFEYEDSGTHELKGIAQPVQVWRVVSEGRFDSRYEARRDGARLPLVGRQEELGLLARAWEASREGHGQVVLIQGEAGIGKSRLVDALREQVSGENYTWVAARCSPYHSNSMLYPVIEHLTRAVGWKPEDGTEKKLDKLEGALREQSLPLEDVIPLYADLLSLSLPEGRYEPLALDPKQRREATLDALVGWLLDEAERKPVLQVWEDLHWADPTTLELLGLYIEQSPMVSMLNVLTYRPEFVPPWSMRSHMTPITLNRLERPEVEVLIEHQANGKTVPSEVMEHIVTKADGVPLFVEELTKTILESEYLSEEADRYTLKGSLAESSIPTTLHDSLMARLDVVPTVREVAQLGAVIGREFAYEMLQLLAPMEEPVLMDGLRKLVEHELLYQRSRPPRSRYIFKHALIRDAAYQSLLRRTRQHYHQRVAELLQERFPETVEASPELLAHHYTEAGDLEHAVVHWQRAGERAREQLANLEAIAHVTRGLSVLQGLPDNREKALKELELQTSLGAACVVAKGHGAVEVEVAYTRARELCQQLGDVPELIQVLVGLWRFYIVSRPLEDAMDVVMELLRLSEEGRDTVRYVMAHYACGVTTLMVGNLADSRSHFAKMIAEYKPIQRSADVYRTGVDPGAAGLAYSSMTEWLLGFPDRAQDQVRESVARAEELEDAYSLALAYAIGAIVWEMCGSDAESQKMAENASYLTIEQEIPFLGAFSRISTSWIAFKGEQSEARLDALRDSVSAKPDLGFAPYFMALLARANRRVEQIEESLQVLDSVQALVERRGERWWEAEIHRLQGELSLAKSSEKVGAAENCFEKALDLAQCQGAKSLELRAAMSLARLWQQQSKRQEAHGLLEPVYSWFNEGFDTCDLREAKALLEQLS